MPPRDERHRDRATAGGNAGRRTLSRLADGWDNDDVRVRPGRGSRPRTKNRPDHRQAVRGFVVAVDRGRYTCLVRSEGAADRTVTAMRARELRRTPVVVGDDVDLVGDVTGRTDTLARIVRVAERRSVLRRSADDNAAVERVVVANADALLIVAAAADPTPRTGFIDRCLVAAYAGGLAPMLLVTKTDLRDPGELVRHYADLELPVLTSGRATQDTLDGDCLDRIGTALRGRTTALIGHSGVGKSTLVNALVPDAGRAIGTVTGIGKGRHTSTSVVALRLASGSWIIDTPGVRGFGLGHVGADDLLEAFDDLLPATAGCPPGCDHHAPDIGCALDAFVVGHATAAGRLRSFRRLLASRGEAATG